MVYHPFRHIGLQLVALGLAVLLWFVVGRDPIVERALRVPLHFQNVPELIEILGEPLGAVDVMVSGTSGVVSQLQSGDLSAIVDLRTAEPGFRLFNLGVENVDAPFGVEIHQVSPPSVAIELERTGSKVVPVNPLVEGEPASGFVVGNVSSSPGTVEVIGPESSLRRLTEVTTEPLSVADATETVRDEVVIGIPDSALRLESPTNAVVTASVIPAQVLRNLHNVTVRVRNLSFPLSAQLKPRVVSISIGAPREVARALSSISIDAYVDLTGLEPGQYDLPVRTSLPQKIGVNSIKPPMVMVTVQ
jgi:YbbR domain-containing protein